MARGKGRTVDAGNFATSRELLKIEQNVLTFCFSLASNIGPKRPKIRPGSLPDDEDGGRGKVITSLTPWHFLRTIVLEDNGKSIHAGVINKTVVYGLYI